MNLGRLGKLDDLQMRAYVQHIPPKKKRKQTTGNTTKQKFIVFDVFAENFGNGKSHGLTIAVGRKAKRPDPMTTWIAATAAGAAGMAPKQFHRTPRVNKTLTFLQGGGLTG